MIKISFIQSKFSGEYLAIQKLYLLKEKVEFFQLKETQFQEYQFLKIQKTNKIILCLHKSVTNYLNKNWS